MYRANSAAANFSTGVARVPTLMLQAGSPDLTRTKSFKSKSPRSCDWMNLIYVVGNTLSRCLLVRLLMKVGYTALVLLMITILGSAPNPMVSAQPSGSANLGLVRLATFPSLNALSPVNARPVIAEMYMWCASININPPVQPQLCQSWSSSNNYTQWTLNLLPGLKWDNGQPLNATDLAYSVYLLNYTYGLGFLQSTSIINETAVNVILNSPQPNFMFIMVSANFWILPYATYKGIPLADTGSLTNFSNIIADGPYVIYNYTSGVNPLVMQVNPYFYRGSPSLQNVYVYLYSSLSAEESALEAGDLDFVWLQGGHNVVQPFLTLPGYTVDTLVASGYKIALFNYVAYPFSSAAFRQALAYYVNRTAIAQTVAGPGAPLQTYALVDAAINGFEPQGIPEYNYNPTAARDLLLSTGLKQVNGAWSYSNGTAISIDILSPSDQPDSGSIATLLSQAWQDAGFRVTVTTADEASVYAQLLTTNWQVAVYTELGSYANAYVGLSSCCVDIGNGNNGLLYENDSGTVPITAAFGNVMNTLGSLPFGSSEFLSLSQTVTAMVAQLVPAIPFYLTTQYGVSSNRFYWGNLTEGTGIFSNQLVVQPGFWQDTLFNLHEVGASTSTVVTSTNSITPSPSMGLTGYIGAGLVVIVIVLLAVMIQRRRKPREVTSNK